VPHFATPGITRDSPHSYDPQKNLLLLRGVYKEDRSDQIKGKRPAEECRRAAKRPAVPAASGPAASAPSAPPRDRTWSRPSTVSGPDTFVLPCQPASSGCAAASHDTAAGRLEVPLVAEQTGRTAVVGNSVDAKQAISSLIDTVIAVCAAGRCEVAAEMQSIAGPQASAEEKLIVLKTLMAARNVAVHTG
jgi:hypothetical protein